MKAFTGVRSTVHCLWTTICLTCYYGHGFLLPHSAVPGNNVNSDCELLWGTNDVESKIGRFVEYNVSDKTFSGRVTRMTAFQESKSTLPEWMSFNTTSSSFTALPVSQEDVREHYIAIQAFGHDGGICAHDMFSWTITEDPGNSACAQTNMPSYTMTILLDVDWQNLNLMQKHAILLKFSSYLDVNVSDFTVRLTGAKGMTDLLQTSAFSAGPGNAIAPLFSVVNLSFVVGCDAVVSAGKQEELMLLVEDAARDGSMSAFVGVPILGWTVHTSKRISPSRRQPGSLHLLNTPEPSPIMPLPSVSYYQLPSISADGWYTLDLPALQKSFFQSSLLNQSELINHTNTKDDIFEFQDENVDIGILKLAENVGNRHDLDPRPLPEPSLFGDISQTATFTPPLTDYINFHDSPGDRRCLVMPTTLDGMALYPHGPGAGDAALESTECHHTSKTLSLPFELPFCGALYRHLKVDKDGFLSLLTSFKGHNREHGSYESLLSPCHGESSEPLIAPFCAKTALTRRSNVFFRTLSRSHNSTTMECVSKLDELIMYDITRDIRLSQQPEHENFTAQHGILVTWRNVTFEGKLFDNDLLDAEPVPENSFQILLVTDGSQTFVLFYYKDVSWTTPPDMRQGLGGIPATVGFNCGQSTDGRFWEYPPYSRGKQLSAIDESTNIGRIGRYLFRIDPTF